MRVIVTLILLISFGWQASAPSMIVPKVEHHQHQEIKTYDVITRSCPDGYEGHFVDVQPGFDNGYWSNGVLANQGFMIQTVDTPGYTICFSVKFMDEVRKNPDLLAVRPGPIKPV